MARFGRILLLAALAASLVADFEGGPRRSAGDRASRGTAIAAESVGSSIQGITVTRPVPSVSESLSDVQARAPFLQAPSPRDRHIRRHRIPRAGDTGIFSSQLSLSLSPATPISAAPVSMAPAFDASFTGLANPNPVTLGDVIPPDTMGAAGPGHLVSILNSQFGVFTTAGSPVGSPVSLRGFWISLDNATVQPSQFAFDPKILYDTNSGRFIAVTLSANDAPPSWVLIAMSQNSDPTGTWYKVAIRADVGTDNTFWADYPGLGVDTNNIYITANMFNTGGTSFQGSKVWVVSKGEPLLNGGTGDLTWTEIRHPASLGDSMQPAHTFGAAPVEYFLREAGSNMVRLASVTGGTTWTELGPVSVTSFASLSTLPGAPQFGNPNGIDTSDTRLLNAVFRNGSLWTTHHVLGASGRVEVAWYQINPGPPILVAQGGPNNPARISDPTRWYYYPSIAVNDNNDVAIGFTGSSTAEYPSAYYTARKNTDFAGTMQPPSLLKTGEAPYFKTLTGPQNRWGDFSATVVDPTDNLTFWTLQEYAKTPNPSDGRSMWGTWWGKFRAPVIAAPTLSAVVVFTTQVDLTWTLPGGQTDFRVERRQLPGQDFATLVTLGASATTYIDNTGTPGATYSYRVRAFAPGSGPDSYSNEVTVPLTAPPSPPVASGGGGGGGCSISNGKIRNEDRSAVTTVLALLLPLPILGVRGRIRRLLSLREVPKARR